MLSRDERDQILPQTTMGSEVTISKLYDTDRHVSCQCDVNNYSFVARVFNFTDNTVSTIYKSEVSLAAKNDPLLVRAFGKLRTVYLLDNIDNNVALVSDEIRDVFNVIANESVHKTIDFELMTNDQGVREEFEDWCCEVAERNGAYDEY